MRVLKLLGVVLLIGLTVLSYADTLSFDFINWGDDVRVYDNARAYELAPHTIFWYFTNAYAGAYAPLAFLSHALDIALWGLKSSGHHLTNLLLHVSNAVLVFLLCVHLMNALYRSSGAEMIGVPFFAAALFATHPLAIPAVAWIAARGILLCEFFVLLACLFSLRSYIAQRRTGRFYAAIACFTLACLADAGALLLPTVLVVIGRLARGETYPRVQELITNKLVLFGVSLLFLTASILASASHQSEEMWDVHSTLHRLALPFVQLFRPILLFMNPSYISPLPPCRAMSLSESHSSSLARSRWLCSIWRSVEYPHPPWSGLRMLPLRCRGLLQSHMEFISLIYLSPSSRSRWQALAGLFTIDTFAGAHDSPSPSLLPVLSSPSPSSHRDSKQCGGMLHLFGDTSSRSIRQCRRRTTFSASHCRPTAEFRRQKKHTLAQST